MKRILTAALSLFLALSPAGCAGRDPAPAGTVPELEPAARSYYAGQDARAFRMLQKHTFQNMLEWWAAAALGEDVKNPRWDFDSFTRYEILDAEGNPAPAGELYCCTFRADGGRYGFAVVEYLEDGPALSNRGVFETPFPYDLRAQSGEITAALGGAGLDLPSAAAARVRLEGKDGGPSAEAVRFTDSGGREFLYRFGAPGDGAPDAA